ncbi:MAG: glycoside hydrolase family 130 protein [Sphingomonas bacterium]
MAIFQRLAVRLTADPTRVVVRPFHLSWQAGEGKPTRARQLVDDICEMPEVMVEESLANVLADFEPRHWHTRRIFETRFGELAQQLDIDPDSLSLARRELIGAYFCHEYSYAAAALMNPSIVPHPDQTGLERGTVRFIMSLRAVGEGHISSIAFREGLVSADGSFYLAPEPPFATAAVLEHDQSAMAEGVVEVSRNSDSNLSGTVLFPVTPEQANGLEDLRLTRFVEEDGSVEWIGTYTAYSGRDIRSELLRTTDFQRFVLQPMTGSARVNKGMALFPRRIDGRYHMIGRQDGKNLFLLVSDSLGDWDGGQLLLEPRYPWEFIQIGNCGAPIELDEGWLLLTHGVGPMRKYSIGAALLDKNDPSKVLGRTIEPLLSAADHDREGYVPNVVYTCGALKLGKRLFVPYGIADSSVAFAFAEISDILGRMG